MTLEPTTNFRDSNGVDLGTKLVTKDYFISVYPSIAQQIGIPPELWTWGAGILGQLGNGAISDRTTLVTTLTGGTNWKQVSSGGFHTAAIKTDGTLWTWGSGNYGRLGNNSTILRISTPVTTFAGGTNWKQVSSGGAHTAAIKTDGTLWVWGDNDYGRLGNTEISNNIFTPVTTFAGGTNWKQISFGDRHTAAIKTDGTLWTWGNASDGRLGNAALTNRSTPVTTFAGGTNWKQVSVGRFHTSAIKTDGTLWVWGLNNDGQLGNADTGGNRSTPITTFAGGTNWKQVSAGYRHTLALKDDGVNKELYVFGNNTTGSLGLGNYYKPAPSTTFAGGTNWKQVSSGGAHTAAIKTDGTLWTWGNGGNGQLAINFTLNKNTPVTTFAGGTNWKQVSSGNSHTAAIKSVDF